MTERFTEELLREVWNEAIRQQAEPYVLQERAAIVAWLDKKAEDFVLNPPHAYSDMITAIVSMSVVGCAEAIEAGEHLK